jgi:hypothetical protein
MGAMRREINSLTYYSGLMKEGLMKSANERCGRN